MANNEKRSGVLGYFRMGVEPAGFERFLLLLRKCPFIIPADVLAPAAASSVRALRCFAIRLRPFMKSSGI